MNTMQTSVPMKLSLAVLLLAGLTAGGREGLRADEPRQGAQTLAMVLRSADNGTVKRVRVYGSEAKPLRANFAEWEIVLKEMGPGERKVTAHAEDAADNVEPRPHVVVVP